jgi:putative oxidoreductase
MNPNSRFILVHALAHMNQWSDIMDSARYFSLAGRLLIGLPFAMGGLSKLAAYGQTTAIIAAAGLPVPPLAFAVAVAVELGGGLLLVAGYQARLVATGLALYCLVTAFSFHSNFAHQNQMFHFLKNVMMAGGLLQITAFGAGALSIDNRLLKGRGSIASVAPAGLT